jgi:hypothetical protein
MLYILYIAFIVDYWMLYKAKKSSDGDDNSDDGWWLEVAVVELQYK